MRLFSAFILSIIALSSVAKGRSITVHNACPFTIWPALYTDPNAGGPIPNYRTGWEAPPSTLVTFDVPDIWKAGRIWGRRGRDFSVNPGPNSCLDGGCNGGLECDRKSGTVRRPSDYPCRIYIIDGFNLPMQIITNTAGCHIASCPQDLIPNCPAGLKGPLDSRGSPVGCKSDCKVDPNPTNSPSCCSGSHNTPQTCPNSGVPHYSYFKSRCPNSYVYAYDESSGTAIWTCPAPSKAAYTITFCP